MTSAFAAADEIQEVRVPEPRAPGDEAVYYYRMPRGKDAPTDRRRLQVLIVVPGYNGDGRQFLRDESWTRFADLRGLVLVGPSFVSNQKEVHSRQGYYYAALWSGETTLRAIEAIRRREEAEILTDRLFLFGVSAGAHFVHRFALWRPGRVAAFAVYSAAWWDEPEAGVSRTPGLVMCGEADDRFPATQRFFQQGIELGAPWIWRGYAHTGHALTPAAVRMAQAFLGHYASGARAQPWIGDAQSYVAAPARTQADDIPDDVRVTLPSAEVAKVWMQE